MFCTHHRNAERVRVLLHVVTDEDILGALRVLRNRSDKTVVSITLGTNL